MKTNTQLIIGTIGMLFAYILLLPSEPAQVITPLDKDEQLNLIVLLGTQGVQEAHKNGCYKEITYKIRTGLWDDAWCYAHYRHIKFN